MSRPNFAPRYHYIPDALFFIVAFVMFLSFTPVVILGYGVWKAVTT